MKMNPPKCHELDYIHFLMAAQKYSPVQKLPDAIEMTLLLLLQHHPMMHLPGCCAEASRPGSIMARVWQVYRTRREDCWLLDDTTLDKPYAEKMDLVTYHWSGKHHNVVRRINLITLLWSDGEALVPTDFRVYDKPAGLTKNDHFRDMLIYVKVPSDYTFFIQLLLSCQESK